jgi:hypothetical protein
LTGVNITWGTVAGATSYDLQVDGGSIITGVTSPYTYSPGNSADHTYAVRVNNACGTGSFSGTTIGKDSSAGPPSVGTLYLQKVAADLLIRWNPISDPNLVDYYEVMRALSPAGPFDTQVGTTSGIVTGLYLQLDAQPPTAYYKVRAAKGTCVGPIDGK